MFQLLSATPFKENSWCRFTLCEKPLPKTLFSFAAAQSKGQPLKMGITQILGRLIITKSTARPHPRWLSAMAEKETSASTVVEAKTSAPKQPRENRLLFHKVAKAKRDSNIADILNKWVNGGNNIRRFDLVRLSNYFRKRRNFHAALQLYEWMDGSNFESYNSDQAVRIDILCKTGGVASAEKYFDSLQTSEKTTKTYGALLACYCREGVLDKALAVFKEMKELNYLSTLNYNNLMSLYHALRQPKKTVALLQEMEEENIALNLHSYNLLINSYAATNDLASIEGVLEKMKSNNMECDLFTYGNLATIYFNSGLVEVAKRYLEITEKMENQKARDVFESCRTRIKLYSEMNDLSGVNRAWEALKSAFTPNNTSYLFMLSALSKLGDQESLENLFMEWDGRHSTYDCRLLNVLLKFYLNRNLIEKAYSLYESMANRETNLNLMSLDLFAALCVKKGQIDLALQYVDKGLERARQGNQKWFPTDETIKLLVEYLENNSDTERAEKFIQSMKTVDRLDAKSLLLNIEVSNAES